MKIREAVPEDKEEIVEVLIASLGTTDLPITTEIWNYKHVENPFGRSLVLLAEEEGKIVGVRAFMCWRWQENGEIFTTYRAVDTATHPKHQGKGIFKKLTLAAVKMATEKNDHFIFNTPNEKSRPGYLKMGWAVVDKLHIGLKPAFNSFYKFDSNKVDYKVNLKDSTEQIEKLCVKWNAFQKKSGKLFTPKTRDFLYWRYESNPLQKYEVLAEGGIYLAVYVKQRGRLKELRVAECLHNNDSGDLKLINKLISQLSKRFGVQFISYSPDLLDLGSFSIKGNIGPVFTLRELNLTPDKRNELLKIKNWNYSIGDLELF
jgi:GNAT superfamily N-acetyltransferase